MSSRWCSGCATWWSVSANGPTLWGDGLKTRATHATDRPRMARCEKKSGDFRRAAYSRSPAASRANEMRPHLELLVEPHSETIRQTGECAPMPLEPLLCHPHDEKLWRAMGPAREPERTMATRSVRVAEMLRAAQHQIQLERSPSLASWLPRVDLSGDRDAEKRGASEVMQADDALFQTGADHPIARRLRARADCEERASNEGCRSPRPPRHGPSSVSLAACPRNTPRGQTGDTCLLRHRPRSISRANAPRGAASRPPLVSQHPPRRAGGSTPARCRPSTRSPFAWRRCCR